MHHLLLEFTDSGSPPQEDLNKIIKLGSKIISQQSARVLEIEVPTESISDLELLLPNWELSILGYYGIPELGAPDSFHTSKPLWSLNRDELAELAMAIREYLVRKNNRVRLANLVSALTNKNIRWQSILEAIKESQDIQEDGVTVWLNI